MLCNTYSSDLFANYYSITKKKGSRLLKVTYKLVLLTSKYLDKGNRFLNKLFFKFKCTLYYTYGQTFCIATNHFTYIPAQLILFLKRYILSNITLKDGAALN